MFYCNIDDFMMYVTCLGVQLSGWKAGYKLINQSINNAALELIWDIKLKWTLCLVHFYILEIAFVINVKTCDRALWHLLWLSCMDDSFQWSTLLLGHPSDVLHVLVREACFWIIGISTSQHSPLCSDNSCSATAFTCWSGQCIPLRWRCDKHNDCLDGSDELHCPTQSSISCPAAMFTCDNNKCIPRTWLCDTDNDCGDGSDEKNCSKYLRKLKYDLLSSLGQMLFHSDTGRAILRRPGVALLSMYNL